MTTIWRTFLCLLLLGASLSTSGCSTNVQLKADRRAVIGRSAYVYGTDDSSGVNAMIRDHMKKLGFGIAENKASADLIVDYHIIMKRNYLDYPNYRLAYFTLFMTDRKSGEIILQSRFSSYLSPGAELAIGLSFAKIENELGAE